MLFRKPSGDRFSSVASCAMCNSGPKRASNVSSIVISQSSELKRT
jgi:hypothetical protein